MKEHNVRAQTFARNGSLEALLDELSALLGPAEQVAINGAGAPEMPVVIIVGSPRSGTTLLLQWLATLRHFAYPTNFLSRFYAAPYIGARIQQLLTDPALQYRDEFRELANLNFSFDSALGKTQGLLSPNEFWYFWRRFFKYGSCHYLNEEELKDVDGTTFSAELGALEAAFDKPFVMKGMIVNSNLDFVDKLLDRVLFVYIKRKPFYNIQSLLEARVNFSGSVDNWYSFRPQEYAELVKLDPVRQVAGQIYHLNRAVEEGLAKIAPTRRLEISYEAFSADPSAIYAAIRSRFLAQGCDRLPQEYNGPPSFQATDRIRVDAATAKEITAAWQSFSGEPALP